MSTTSGYKIIYRFTLKPGVWSKFVELQQRAHELYSKHVTYQLEFVRSEVDPDDVMEIQTYASQADAKRIENLHEVEPELATLFQAFLALLDPAKPSIETIVGAYINL